MLGEGGIQQRDTFAASDAPDMPPMSMHCAPRACPCVSPLRFCWTSPPRDPKKNTAVVGTGQVGSFLATTAQERLLFAHFSERCAGLALDRT